MKKKSRGKLIVYGIVVFLGLIVLLKVLSDREILILNRTGRFGREEKKPAHIKVAIFNGCGVNGTARKTVTYLVGLDANFEVVNGLGENAEHFDFPSSIVVDRRGKPEIARRIAAALGIQDVILQRTTDPYLIEDVAVIIGKDYTSLIPLRE